MVKLGNQEYTNSEIREDYKEKFGENDTPEKKLCKKDAKAYIGDKTENRITWNGMPWIDYWRVFEHSSKNIYVCAVCGKRIYAHWDSLSAEEKKSFIKDDHQAMGGHIVFDKTVRDFWIVPLCPSCNKLAGNSEINFHNDVNAYHEKHHKIKE